MTKPVRLEINFLQKQTGNWNALLIGTIILTLCLLTGLFAYWYLQKSGLELQKKEYLSLQEQVYRNETETEKFKSFEQMEAETNTLCSVVNLVGKQKYAYSPYLYELNSLLPSSITMEEIELTAELITIKGNSAEYYGISQLLAAINASPLMLNARKLTTQSAASGQIRFNLEIEYIGAGK